MGVLNIFILPVKFKRKVKASATLNKWYRTGASPTVWENLKIKTVLSRQDVVKDFGIYVKTVPSITRNAYM